MTKARLRWRPSPLARRLVLLAATGLGLAAVTRRPELLTLAAPALWLLASAPHPELPAEVDLEHSLDPPRCFEGERVRLRVSLATAGPIEELTASIELAPGLAAPDDPPRQISATGRLELDVVLVPQRWGRWTAGTAVIEGRAGLRLLAATASVRLDQPLLVFPHPSSLASVVSPRTLPHGVGDHASREPATGIEFAGIRPYVAGDPARRINWPVSTRRGTLHVTTHAAERPVDVVVVLDAFSDVGPPGATSLDVAVRGATGTASAYLRDRDRVGLVVAGGTLRWLTPSIRERQFYRIVEEVLLVRRDRSFLEPDVARVPRAALPPAALVVVFSPLLDDRMLEVIRDLRERGFATVVVDVLTVEPPDVAPGRVGGLALRLWRLEQATLRARLRALGITVLPWAGDGPLDLRLPGGPTNRLSAAGGRP